MDIDLAENSTTSIERALKILEAFKSGDGRLSLQDLAGRTDLNKATIIRLIASLEKFNYVQKYEKGSYMLGPAFLPLAKVYSSSFMLSEHAVPILRNLANQTDQSAAYFIRDGEMRLCLFKIESPTSALITRLKAGDRLPILPSGTGKVLLAFSENAEERSGWLDVANAMMAVNVGERSNEIASIAIPVFGPDQKLKGTVSVSGVPSEFEPALIDQYRPHVARAAARLTMLLGGDETPIVRHHLPAG